ncbi:cupin domain-containing protein [Pedobacter yulinensis]|uniref:Cupin domain-containing protein n=1 Tax=Pedobacter yulinensis TaxID=2126353 RepID=A0A2T3HL66_9SPHI|nr:cupin domain-containing protein [Pedobacter yulinensis]PST83131.1 cupin domain-containing protein [Pedobacter yulinensis]
MKKSIHNTEHYKWGADCDGWHLLKSPTLSVIQERIPPGAGEALHYHERSQQLFYILSGTATFLVGTTTEILAAGESIHIPGGEAHLIRNDSAQLLNFLVISEPMAHGDRINL